MQSQKSSSVGVVILAEWQKCGVKFKNTTSVPHLQLQHVISDSTFMHSQLHGISGMLTQLAG